MRRHSQQTPRKRRLRVNEHPKDYGRSLVVGRPLVNRSNSAVAATFHGQQVSWKATIGAYHRDPPSTPWLPGSRRGRHDADETHRVDFPGSSTASRTRGRQMNNTFEDVGFVFKFGVEICLMVVPLTAVPVLVRCKTAFVVLGADRFSFA